MHPGDPNPIERLIKESAASSIDASVDFHRDDAFLLYASFGADVERTAYAASLTPDQVRAMALEGGWDEKLRSIIQLRKSQRPGDLERAINRSLNYVQAHRMRLILESIIRRISAMSADELRTATTHKTFGRDGEVISETLSTRPLADLTSALEKAQMLSYMALGDSATERKARPQETDDDRTASEIHAALAAAFAKSKTS
jgi:hypothetical protein